MAFCWDHFFPRVFPSLLSTWSKDRLKKRKNRNNSVIWQYDFISFMIWHLTWQCWAWQMTTQQSKDSCKPVIKLQARVEWCHKNVKLDKQIRFSNFAGHGSDREGFRNPNNEINLKGGIFGTLNFRIFLSEWGVLDQLFPNLYVCVSHGPWLCTWWQGC